MSQSIWKKQEKKKDTTGTRISNLRKSKKVRDHGVSRMMNQDDLAGKLNRISRFVDRGVISDIENDKKDVDAKEIKKLCEIFQCSADYLVCNNLDHPTHEETDICKYTGLSEPAIKKLHALMSSRDLATQKTAPVLLDCLNLLIENIDSKKPYTSVLWDISFLTHADQMSLSTETSTGDLKLNNLSFDDEYAKVGYAPGAQKLIEGITEEFFKTRVFDGLRNLGKKKAKRKRTPCPTYTK